MFGQMMYLRPGNLWKDFILEKSIGTTSDSGRAGTQYLQDEDNIKIVTGILSEATQEEKYQWQQQQHPITHVILQRGKRVAAIGDRLVLKDRYFYVQGIDDTVDLGLFTFYYAEERRG